jgi:hypothetical protein
MTGERPVLCWKGHEKGHCRGHHVFRVPSWPRELRLRRGARAAVQPAASLQKLGWWFRESLLGTRFLCQATRQGTNATRGCTIPERGAVGLLPLCPLPERAGEAVTDNPGPQIAGRGCGMVAERALARRQAHTKSATPPYSRPNRERMYARNSRRTIVSGGGAPWTIRSGERSHLYAFTVLSRLPP